MWPTFQEYDLTSMGGEIHSKMIGYKRRPTIREALRRPSSSPTLMPIMVTISLHDWTIGFRNHFPINTNLTMPV